MKRICIRKNSLAWPNLMFILIICLGVFGCRSTEPIGGGSHLFDIVIENQTDQVLTIYYEDFKVGTIRPAEHIVVENLVWDIGMYPFRAEDTRGETVFSETFTFIPDDKYHLQEIEEAKVYKAVIPPLESK